MLSAKQGN